jgi:hypothetical protein
MNVGLAACWFAFVIVILHWVRVGNRSPAVHAMAFCPKRWWQQ